MIGTNIVLFSGYAKLPGGTVSAEVYKVMALVVLIDVDTGRIVDAECTLSTALSERFVRTLLVDRHIVNDAQRVIQSIDLTYQGNAKKAIINSWRIIGAKYNAYIRECQKQL